MRKGTISIWFTRLKGLLVLQFFGGTIFYQFKQAAQHLTVHDLHGHDTFLLSFCILNPLNKNHVCFT